MLECLAVAKIVFMGTPEFAVPALQALAEKHTVVGVVTQPDRPAGRGRKVIEPPVKQFARQAGLRGKPPILLLRKVACGRPVA